MTDPQIRQYRAFGPLMAAGVLCLTILCSTAAVGQLRSRTASEAGYLTLWKQGEYKKALNQLEQRMAMYDPNRVPAHMRFHHGELLFATGKINEAIEAFEESVDRYPEPEYLLALAEAHMYRGQPLYAERVLERASSIVNGPWRFSVRPDNLVAVGRIHELTGSQNPKALLNTYYGQVFERYPSSPETYVGAGELALRYNGYALAAKHFTKALELDENHVEALAGLVETYRKSGDPRLEESIARLHEANPNHPRLLAVQAELLLDLGLTQEAHEFIERGLAINPLDLRLLSLQSGAYFLEYNDEAMRAVQDKVLEFNPLWSQVYQETGRIAARHYRFREALAFQKKALEIDPNDADARAEYTLNLMRLGNEDEGRVELEKAFDTHPYNVSLYNLLQLMETLDRFQVIENEDFVLKLPEDEAIVLADDALALLDDAIEQYEADYKITLERPILVEMFDSHDDFMVRSVGLPGSVGHLGICFGKVVTMDTPSVRAPGSSNWHAVLWHEFVHVITLQKTKNRMPRWLSEGISVFEEGRRSKAWHNPLNPNYAPIVAANPAPKVDELTNFFIKPESSGHLMYGYFISGEFVSFYVKEYGFEALVEALRLIGEREQTEAALATAANTDLNALNNGFAAYLEGRLAPYDNIPKPQEEEEAKGLVEELVELLPLGEDAQLSSDGEEAPFNAAMKRAQEAAESGDLAAAEKAFREAHKLFPDYTGGDAPLRQLAALYEREGKQEKLVNLWREMIEWSPTELNAARSLMRHAADAEDWSSAVRYAELATGIDPYDVSTRRTLVRGYRELADYDTALAEIEIVEHLDASRSPEHRLLRAQLLDEAGRPKEAREGVVALLEELPHYWEAQKLLLRLAGEPVGAGQ